MVEEVNSNGKIQHLYFKDEHFADIRSKIFGPQRRGAPAIKVVRRGSRRGPAGKYFR